MTPSDSSGRAAQIHAKIHAFIRDKLGDQDASLKSIDDEIELTAERAKTIQQATHIVKGIHSGADGTNICAFPEQLP